MVSDFMKRGYKWLISEYYNKETGWCPTIAQIPAEALYNGMAGDIVTKMDFDTDFDYNKIVHGGLKNMLWKLNLFYNLRLKDILLPIRSWQDLWTGSGIVTMKLSSDILQIIANAETLSLIRDAWFPIEKISSLEDILVILWAVERNWRNWIWEEERDQFWDLHPIQLQCSDLCETTLRVAIKNLQSVIPASEVLEISAKSWDIKKEDSLLPHILPSLITLFNVFTNFSGEEIIESSKNIYNKMKPGDLFIPSFFQYVEWSNDISLYDNIETEFWVKTAIHQYDITTHNNLNFLVEQKSEKERQYIDVWCYDKSKNIYYSGFKSYRDTKRYLHELFEEIWFTIHLRLESDDKHQIAPVLQK